MPTTTINGIQITAANAANADNATYATTAGIASSVSTLTQNVTINGNLQVIGTSSISYSTASIVRVGSSTITLNTNNPATRFGGITVVDSGSFGNASTGSLFWDSLNNRWIYANPSGSSYDGGMLISGPRNVSGSGNEQGTTLNALMKGQGGDHITSSGIFEDGTTTNIYNKMYVSSSGLVMVTGSLRGQITALSVASNTASLDMSANNFFTLTLPNGANTFINPSNIQPGQTVNVRVTQGSSGTGTVSFPAFVDQPSGSMYTGSMSANTIDIVTMITFDATSVYLSSIKNML